MLERLIGFERLTVWHARNGRAALTLLVAHAVLITAGYTVGDKISLPSEIGRLWSGYPGVITATAGLVILIGVVVTSVVAVRRRLRYETWYFVHLYAYLGVALAFSHQLATGTDFVGDPAARAYWTALYVVTLGALVVFRLGIPVARSAWHGLRVARVREEAPGVTTIEIEGRRLERLQRARRPVLHLALPHPRPLVGGAPVLALGRARRPPAAHHGQGPRRLHVGAAGDPARHARDRRGARSAPSPPPPGGARASR